MKTIKKDIYPLTIIYDRYGGTYSSGKYTAWNQFHYAIPESIDGDDMTCGYFWWNEFKQGAMRGFMNEKVFVGFGNTIEEAIDDLKNRLQYENN